MKFKINWINGNFIQKLMIMIKNQYSYEIQIISIIKTQLSKFNLYSNQSSYSYDTKLRQFLVQAIKKTFINQVECQSLLNQTNQCQFNHIKIIQKRLANHLFSIIVQIKVKRNRTIKYERGSNIIEIFKNQKKLRMMKQKKQNQIFGQKKNQKIQKLLDNTLNYAKNKMKFQKRFKEI
ncbi:unnamed protein product [Paramecium sonneborni]|uniref:Uncharacterized protein n=1 Tax=Paramecium sonneborni TaxID=65129 RepID=A0A8S1NVX3_9CILI|nr:unnamed protein product [Paramecium sonneborni]